VHAILVMEAYHQCIRPLLVSALSSFLALIPSPIVQHLDSPATADTANHYLSISVLQTETGQRTSGSK
jgi:hypothetical protein